MRLFRTNLPLNDELLGVLGKPLSKRKLHSSPRSKVWRVELGSRTVIVKQVVGDGDPSARFAREVTALRLAGRATPAVAPELIATGDAENVLVLELLERIRPDEHWATGYADALARLHATTSKADADALPAWRGPAPADVDSFLEFSRALGLTPVFAVREELSELLARLDRSGHFALLHGDPCPGNDLHTEAGVRFVDFEHASLGNGLMELAYLHVGFPTCWSSMALSTQLLAEAENAYRQTWEEITGRDVPGSLADACLGWLIRGDSLVEYAHRGTRDQLARAAHEDWDWGPPTARERILHRLDVIGGLIDREEAGSRPAAPIDQGTGTPGLTATRELLHDMRTRMLERWPDLRPFPTTRDDRLDTNS